MSKLEMQYRKHLNNLTKATHPRDRVVKIEEQVPYSFVINGVKICTYKLDFRVTYADGSVEHVDTKGARTAVYSLKAKLFHATQGFKIKEVYSKDFPH